MIHYAIVLYVERICHYSFPLHSSNLKKNITETFSLVRCYFVAVKRPQSDLKATKTMVISISTF